MQEVRIDDIDNQATWQPSPVFLRYAMVVLSIGAVGYLLLLRVLVPEQLTRLIGPSVGLVLAAIVGLLSHFGWYRAAVRFLAIGALMAATVICAFMGGVRTPVVLAYPVLVMLVGWLFSARAALAAGWFSSLMIVAFVVAEHWKVLPQTPETPAAMYGMVQILMISQSTLMIIFLIKTYKARLKELGQSAQEIARKSLELKTSQDRLGIAIQATETLFWEYDHVNDLLSYDDAELKWLGLNPAQAPRSLSQWVGLIHPVDQASILRRFALATSKKGAVLDVDYRLTDQAGGWIWVHNRGTVVERDADGRALRSGGGCTNISSRKQAEEKLSLAALVLENSSEALMITDASNHIQEVNPAFTHLTGFSRNEVIGRKPSILESGRHGPAFYDAMWKTVDATGKWQGEVWNRRKNGELFAEWLTISTLYSEEGHVHRRVGLFSDITEKKKADELIWAQANFDMLTKLPNRRMFRDRLAQCVKVAGRTNLPFALLFLDLDRFKDVNDALGHVKGDALLVEAAHRIVSCVRDADTVSRMGGDEFTVIVTELDHTRSVSRIAQDIIDELSQPYVLESDSVQLSASIGVSMWPADTADLDQLVKNADQAMYAAKNAGRNRFSYFTEGMQLAAVQRMKTLGDLRKALALGQFRLRFQPVVQLATDRVFKAEALLRWHHPEKGELLPESFIALAEESGLIHDIGYWVITAAAQQVQKWQAALGPGFQISVNLSPVQIQSAAHCARWLTQLAAMNLPAGSMALEITEGLLLSHSAGTTAQMLAFRDAGIELAIDDFGTGYSSLSYLQKLDVDYLKIDQSFIRNLASAGADQALSESIVVMAHKLGLKVIAEGVETTAQRDLLVQMECDYAQGNLYSVPLSAAEFEALLAGAQGLLKT
ncbi:MAG: EAL domain-containing protein [Betaproteobacteria bacterium]|jgi:diguanylate cyclase (GGDEF)-like protein/PAS domain S-box-containing protein|nr:EAL domain-containing protein [Betaproteobacteria bacterium]MBP6647415.1 EAL domain-containing protein [Burkholderiaceae bacterium]